MPGRRIGTIRYHKMKHFPAGSTLMKQGESGDELFILHDGAVNVIVEAEGVNPGEKELRVVASLGPGDFGTWRGVIIGGVLLGFYSD